MVLPRPLRSLLLILVLLCAGCVSQPPEPLDGCVLAAANQRQVLLAARYASPELRPRILGVTFGGRTVGHAALVYRLESGWWVYDDVFASRALHLPAVTFPDPILAARAAFPGQPVATARWLDPER